MYRPKAFREDRIEVLHDFVRQHSFATLVTGGAGGLLATHAPLLLDPTKGDRGTLIGHLSPSQFAVA